MTPLEVNEQEEAARNYEHRLRHSLRDSTRLTIPEVHYQQLKVETSAGDVNLYIGGNLQLIDKLPVFITVHDIGRNGECG